MIYSAINKRFEEGRIHLMRIRRYCRYCRYGYFDSCVTRSGELDEDNGNDASVIRTRRCIN